MLPEIVEATGERGKPLGHRACPTWPLRRVALLLPMLLSNRQLVLWGPFPTHTV
jgi:hypothetical protein